MRSRTGRLRDVVLIADSDFDRAERLAAACLEQGIDVVPASHGAQALELALAETPAAMVVQIDLPLIDGERLSSILRANPRTEHLGILLIADEHVEALVDDSIGRVVPGHADPETIAHFLLTLLSKQRASTAPEHDSGAGGIEGDLIQVSLAELIELFHVNRKSGWIELTRRSGRQEERGRVALQEGDLVHAETGAVQGEKALYRLFSWDRGRFAFVPQGVDSDATIERPTRALLREGRRQAAEWDRLVVDIPPDRARVRLAVSRASLPAVLHPLTQEVLMVLELTDRVRDVLDRCDFPDYQVLRTLSTMHRKGLIQLHQEDASPGPAGRSEALPAPLATRLRERLEPGGHRDVKVVVFAADEDAIHAFCGLVGELPGACMDEPEGPTPAIAPLGRIAVEDDLGVEWLGALAEPRFAAAWPLAAHGAIGILFAHAGNVQASISALRPAIERVSALPRARVLHAIFAGKESGSQVGALCDGLSLFDDRSVVEIPVEDPEVSISAIRDLLSRLLA